MCGWDEDIGLAVLDEDGYRDVSNVEAPRSKKCKVIIHPPPDTVHGLLGSRFPDDLTDFGVAIWGGPTR